MTYSEAMDEDTPANGDVLSDDEIASQVGPMIDAAKGYIEEELKFHRKESTDYYHGRPFGNEEDSRSKVVSTDVRDTVLSILPSLLRIFAGNTDRSVEFRPRGKEPKDLAEARQKTDYVNYIINEDNDGFMLYYGGFKDACIRKTGIFKWWVEKKEVVEGDDYTEIDDEQLAILSAAPGVTVTITAKHEATAELPMTYDVTVLKKLKEKKFRVQAVNPEHVYWNRGARSVETSIIFGHSEEILVHEFEAMGNDLEDFAGCIGPSAISADDETNSDSAAKFDEGSTNPSKDAITEEAQVIRYSESYTWGDFDKQGTSLWKICTAGDQHKFVAKQRVSEIPFAVICPDPESHQMIGGDISDLTKDIQLIKSNVRRATLDSLAKAVDPDTVIGSGVNYDDVLSKERSKVIRTDNVDNVKIHEHRFVGADTMLMEDKLDDVLEQRTGRNKNAGGLDADTLQSTTKQAVAATLSASQQRVEMLARIFAETGIKRMFRGIGRMLHLHQDRERTVRLRGEWVNVDPRKWNAEMNVTVNVALGFGTAEDRANALLAIKEDQDMIMQAMGPSNPMVGLTNLRNTRGRLCEMAGFSNSDEFYKPMTPEEQQAIEQAASKPQPPPMDPAAMAMAQAQMMKAQTDEKKAMAEIQIKEREIQLHAMELDMEDDRERDRAAQDMTVALARIEAETGAKLDRHRIDAEVAEHRSEIDAKTQVARAIVDGETRRDVADIQAQAKKETAASASV